MASDFTDGLALQAIKLVFENLESSVRMQTSTHVKMHNASTIMAFAIPLANLDDQLPHSERAGFYLFGSKTRFHKKLVSEIVLFLWHSRLFYIYL